MGWLGLLLNYLVVSAHLKNISQLFLLPKLGWKEQTYLKPPPSEVFLWTCCAPQSTFRGGEYHQLERNASHHKKKKKTIKLTKPIVGGFNPFEKY